MGPRQLRLGLLLALPVLLAGCSGTRFGDQLARSFSTPQSPRGTPAAPAATAPAASPAPAQPARSTQAAQPKTEAAPAPAAKPATRPAAAPAPYRVTLQLPAADPSAPAEVVTEALRAAGVAFEVESIERVVPGAAAPLTPQRSPAPAAP